MFTGLIESVAVIAGRRRRRGGAGELRLRLTVPLADLVTGESIAVNGACLTLETAEGNLLRFHTLAETLRCTNLGLLPLGTKVHLERALQIGERLGGHLITGHIDTTAEVLSVVPAGSDLAMTIALPEKLRPLLVRKGSIAVDGVSLTIAGLADDRFTVQLIPETRRRTALAERRAGDQVNLEADLLAKHVLQTLVSPQTPPRRQLTMDALRRAGW